MAGKGQKVEVELRICGAQTEPIEKEEEEMLNGPSTDIWFLGQKQQ